MVKIYSISGFVDIHSAAEKGKKHINVQKQNYEIV